MVTPTSSSRPRGSPSAMQRARLSLTPLSISVTSSSRVATTVHPTRSASPATPAHDVYSTTPSPSASVAASSTPPLSPQQCLFEYETKKIVGEIESYSFGAHGVVEIRGGIARKQASPSLDSQSQLRNEARVLAAIPPNRNIVRLRCATSTLQNDDATCAAIEMDACGPNLRKCSQSDEWTDEEAVRAIRDTARALEHVHASGFLHNDVKIDNILRDHDNSHYRLCDFGLASPLGGPHEFVGTASHLAPEVHDGLHFSPKSDVWSLGAAARQLVGGLAHPLADQLDHIEEYKFALCLRSVHSHFPPSRNAPSDCRSALYDVINGCMCYNVSDRWTTQHVVARLDCAISETPRRRP